MFGQVLSHCGVHRWILWLPRRESVHVPVIHAERSGDQYRVVDLEVCCAKSSSLLHAFGRDILASLLYLTGDYQKSLKFAGDVSL